MKAAGRLVFLVALIAVAAAAVVTRYRGCVGRFWDDPAGTRASGVNAPSVSGSAEGAGSDATESLVTVERLRSPDEGRDGERTYGDGARTAAITGRVVDQRGAAVDDAVITVASSSRRWLSSPTVDGRFRLDGLPPHEEVRVTARATMAISSEIEARLVEGDLDLGCIAVSAARPLSITASDERGTLLDGISIRIGCEGFSAFGTSNQQGRIQFGEVPRQNIEIGVLTAPWRLVQPDTRRCDSTATSIVITVARGGSVFGVVRDETAQPLGNVVVEAESTYDARIRQFKTGNDGSFHLELDPRLTWDLAFDRRGMPRFVVTSVAGDAGQLDVVLAAMHRCIVDCRDIGSGGAAVELLKIDDRDRGAPRTVDSVDLMAGGSGRAELFFDAGGTYFVRARRHGWGHGWRSSARFVIVDDAPPTTRSEAIVLDGGAALSVKFDGPGAFRGARAYLVGAADHSSDARRVRASWIASRAASRGSFAEFESVALVDHGGVAAFRSLAAGRYRVLYGGRSGLPMQVSCDVVIGADPVTVTASLPDTGAIVGAVKTRAGSVIAATYVYCCSEIGSFRVTLTDASGAYRFDDLAPGAYAVVAQRPGDLARFEFDAHQVTVDGNDNVTYRRRDIRAAESGSISVESARETRHDLVADDPHARRLVGRLLVNGAATQGALIRCKRARDGAVSEATTAVDGSFVLEELDQKRQSLEVWIDGLRWMSTTCDTHPVGDECQPVVLEAMAGSASVQLLDATSGEPVSGVSVGLAELDPRSRGAERRDRVLVTRVTDSTGSIAIARLPHAQYRIDVVARGYQRPEAWLDVARHEASERATVRLERGGWLKIGRSVDPALGDASGFQFELAIEDASYEGVAWFDADGFAWIESGRCVGVDLRISPVCGSRIGSWIERRAAVTAGEITTIIE